MNVKSLMAAALAVAVLLGFALPGPAARATGPQPVSQLSTLALN